MDAFQPVEVIYPDVELQVCRGIGALGLDIDFVGRQMPRDGFATAVVVNRVGGRDPTPVVQIRCFAATPQAATDLARNLAARLPRISRMGLGVVRFRQNEGPTDLGDDPIPLRQLMYDVTVRGRAIKTND